MAIVQHPSPNPKYPFVGDNYLSHGEVAGYLYHPWTDKYYPDPKAQQALASANGVGPKKDPSLAQAVAPIAVAAGAVELAKAGGKGGYDAVTGLFKTGADAAKQGLSSSTPTAAPQVASAPATQASNLQGVAGSGAESGAYPVGTASDGGTLMSDGTTVASDGSILGTAGTILSAAAAAKGSYDAINGAQHGGEGVRSGLTTAGAGIGGLFGGPLGSAVGAAGGNALGYGLQGNGWKNKAAIAGTLGVGSLGLLSVAKHFGFNPIHETTKQFQHNKYQGLMDRGITGLQGIADVKAQQEKQPGYGTFGDGPHSGEKWSFEAAQDRARVNPSEFRNSYGNSDVFGNDWGKYTPEQQDKIVLGLIDAGLYKSKKGLNIITDAEKAKQIRDSVIGAKISTTPLTGVKADDKSNIKKSGLLGVGAK